MKAISKFQVIDLMMGIYRDGVDNEHFNVDVFVCPVHPGKWYGCEEDILRRVLQPGAYCALWIDDTEYSNMPYVGAWIKDKLTDENIMVLPTKDCEKLVVIICLDLF